jgi:hypothetical protein
MTLQRIGQFPPGDARALFESFAPGERQRESGSQRKPNRHGSGAGVARLADRAGLQGSDSHGVVSNLCRHSTMKP